MSVDKLLDSYWVTFGSFDFTCISEGYVFKSVYLTKAPENWVLVLASSLDLEHVG